MVAVTITGVLFDKHNRTQQLVTLMGELDQGVGPGTPPIQPPGSGGVPTHPIMLPGMPGWGDPHPEHPIYNPPGIWGPTDPRPTPPIVIPPPDWKPPDNVTIPPPGSPPVMLPGGGPTHPIVAPPFIVVDYPGMGKVIVPQPVPTDPTKRPPVAQR